MKKLSLLIVGMLVSAITAMAADYYIIGSNANGHYWELGSDDCKFTEVSAGVYKWTGEILGSGFKINDGTWDDEEINFGSNGSALVINSEYFYDTGSLSDNIGIADYTYVVDPEVTLDLNNATLLVSGTPMGQAEYGWKIVGLLNPEEYQLAVSLEPVEGMPDVYEALNVDVHHSGDFKITHNGLTFQYGAPYEGAEINADNMSAVLMRQPVNIGGMNYDLDGTYDIRWDFANTTVTFYNSGQIIDEPETDLYIIGSNVNGKGWELAAEDAKMTYVGNGVYEWEGDMLGTGFKINDGTWSNDNYNFGSNGTSLALGVNYEMALSGGNIDLDGITEVQNPKVRFDLNSRTLLVEGQGAGEIEWFITGTFNGWTFDNKLTEESEGIYTCKDLVFDGAEGSEFKITTTGWVTQYASLSEVITPELLTAVLEEIDGSASGTLITLVGTYDVTWNLNTRTISFTAKGETPDMPETDLYIIGTNVNGKGWELAAEDAKMTYVGNGVYEWEGDMLGTGFKINDGTWSNDNYNFGSNGTSLALGVNYEMALSGGNIDLDGITEVQNPKVRFDLNSRTLLVEGQGAGEIEWFITGTFNGWTFDNKLTEESEGIYTCKDLVFDGAEGSEFKITTTGWATQYGTLSAVVITPESPSAVLEEIDGDLHGCSITLVGTYDVTWNLNTRTISFTLVNPGFSNDEYAVLSVSVNDGMTMTARLPHYGSTTVALGLDEYWEVKSATLNGHAADMDAASDGIEIVMDSDMTLDIEVGYKAELAWVDTLTGEVALGSASSVKVCVKDGNIVVSGLSDGDDVVLYATNGMVISSYKATSATVSVAPMPGVYVVRVNSNAVKVSVR